MNNAIGIKSIASYIPKKRESNYSKQHQFNIDGNFLRNKIGVVEKAVKSEDEETSDLCLRAYEALSAKVPISPEEIQCIIVCTQNPDGDGLPHTSAILHGKIGCSDNTAAFDISLGCSGYVYSLSIASSFMEANRLRKGLLFTADPYSKIIDPGDKNTSLLFGDASTVTLLSCNPEYRIGKILFGTSGADYRALYCENKRLIMNGRAVFNFALTKVPKQVREIVKNSRNDFNDIDLFIFHQGSKYIVDMMCRKLKLDPEKVPINLEKLGNTVSSSIPLLLENAVCTKEYKKILISGFGVGLSWATAILNKIN